MVQPDLDAFDARQLLGQVFRLLLVTLQLQRSGFFAQQARQPAAQLRSALAIATGVAVGGPGAGQQPARGGQGEQAPARVFEFFEELLGRGFAHVFIVQAGLDQRAPVFQQGIEGDTQIVGRLTRSGLAQAADQRAHFREAFDPVLQQAPVTVEAILLGQTLAAAQQMPAQRGERVVQRRFSGDLRCRQAQRIAVGVVQAITALGLADIAWHQGQFLGQLGGQFQQGCRFAFAQFQFQLADFFFLLADHDVTQVQRGFDDHFGLAATPGDFRAFTDEIGGEDRLQGLLVQLGQFLGPAFAVEFLQVELGFGQVPVVLVTHRQAGDALAAGLEGLDHFFAILAQAQGDFGLGQVALGRVEVLIHQLTAFPATFVAFFQ
ncbi:hypothetical protein D3C80_901200 [compost metagenome]